MALMTTIMRNRSNLGCWLRKMSDDEKWRLGFSQQTFTILLALFQLKPRSRVVVVEAVRKAVLGELIEKTTEVNGH